MRMWMVDVKKMCRKHLLGEHVELHMTVGSMKRKRSISGYLQSNCLEPQAILNRHQTIADEMIFRGYKHDSELDAPEDLLDYLNEEERNFKIDKDTSYEDLFERCAACRVVRDYEHI